MTKKAPLSTPAPASAPAPAAVLFDAYGTLFDIYSVGALAEQLYPGQGQALTLLWRDKQIEYTRLVSMSGRYRPFWDLTRAGLRFAVLKLGLAADPVAEDRLMNQYRELPAFAENRDVLLSLRERGIRTGILSNGGPEMLTAALASADLADLVDPVLSAHSVQRFKTDPAVYQLGLDALGLPAQQILFVSSNGWDVIGATWFGFTTLWVNRADAPLESLDTQPTRIGSSLRDVLDFFPPPSA